VRADYLSEITRDTAFAQNEKADRQSCGLAKGQSVTASDRSELDDSSRMMITGDLDLDQTSINRNRRAASTVNGGSESIKAIAMQ